MKIKRACGLLVLSVLWGLLAPLPAQADAEVLEQYVVGAYLAGLVGFIIAVPVAATVIDLLKYFRRSAQQKESE